MNYHMCLHIYIRKLKTYLSKSLSHHINTESICQYKYCYFLSEITTKKILTVLFSFDFVKNSKIPLFVQQATIFERIQTWFKLFMLRAICGQDSNSGISKLLFSVITFVLIRAVQEFGAGLVNKTCFLKDDTNGTHLK